MRNEERVALFLPTFNEENNVRDMIISIRKNFNGFFFIVDGYSTDKTVPIAESMNVPVFNRDAHGKGAAIRKALEIADEKGKEFLLFLDCDKTYSPDDIEKMLKDADDYDVVIGIRDLKTIHPFFRRLGNIVATFIINYPFGGKIKDSISGFKCLRVSKFKDIMQENGFVADALICVYALRYNMKIQLVQIRHIARKEDSKMGFWIGMKELVKLVVAIWRI